MMAWGAMSREFHGKATKQDHAHAQQQKASEIWSVWMTLAQKEILPTPSTKQSLFAKPFLRMGVTFRDKSNDGN